jgi:hypothetical protein
MVALNGRLLEGSDHSLDLTIDPGMAWLGQPVLDAVRITKPVEHMDTPPHCWPEAILREISELEPLSVTTVWIFVGTALI